MNQLRCRFQDQIRHEKTHKRGGKHETFVPQLHRLVVRSLVESYSFWPSQAVWPQSHSSFMAPFAAAQYAEQYFSPAGTEQRQPSIAHFFESAAMIPPTNFEISFWECLVYSDAKTLPQDAGACLVICCFPTDERRASGLSRSTWPRSACGLSPGSARSPPCGEPRSAFCRASPTSQ